MTFFFDGRSTEAISRSSWLELFSKVEGDLLSLAKHWLAKLNDNELNRALQDQAIHAEVGHHKLATFGEGSSSSSSSSSSSDRRLPENSSSANLPMLMAEFAILRTPLLAKVMSPDTGKSKSDCRLSVKSSPRPGSSDNSGKCRHADLKRVLAALRKTKYCTCEDARARKKWQEFQRLCQSFKRPTTWSLRQVVPRPRHKWSKKNIDL